MKTKKELLEEATWNGNWQTSSGAKATLEVLCDIRLLLANRVIGAGSGDPHVINTATELIANETVVQDTSHEEAKS